MLTRERDWRLGDEDDRSRLGVISIVVKTIWRDRVKTSVGSVASVASVVEWPLVEIPVVPHWPEMLSEMKRMHLKSAGCGAGVSNGAHARTATTVTPIMAAFLVFMVTPSQNVILTPKREVSQSLWGRHFPTLSRTCLSYLLTVGGKGDQRQPPPPFTYTVSAVMNWQASEHMNSTSSAISSGSAKRFIGTSSRKRCTSSGELLAAA